MIERGIHCEIKMEYTSVTSPPPNTFRPIQEPDAGQGGAPADPAGAPQQLVSSKTPKLGNWRQGSDNWSSTGSRHSSRCDYHNNENDHHQYNHADDLHPHHHHDDDCDRADLGAGHRVPLDLPPPTCTADRQTRPCQR